MIAVIQILKSEGWDAIQTSIIRIALSVPATTKSNSEFSISLVVGFTIYFPPTRPTRTPATGFVCGNSDSALHIQLSETVYTLHITSIRHYEH